MSRRTACLATATDDDDSALRRNFWRKRGASPRSIPFAEDLLAAYYCAFDRNTPMQVQAALLGALAYFVLPFDAIPDMLPVLGFTDDAAVLAAAIKLVGDHIKPGASRRGARHAGAIARSVVKAAGSTLPITLRAAMSFSACAALRSADRPRAHARQFALARTSAASWPCWRDGRAGSRSVHEPQNTPRTSQPFSSTRLSGSFGISPAAKPTTRKRPVPGDASAAPASA